MKTIGVAMQAHLTGGNHTLARCLRLTLVDATVIAATTHDQDLVIDGVTYLARSGGTMTDTEDNDALAVNNGEMTGLLNLDAITAADLRAGRYDFARISVFDVNYADLTMGAVAQMDGWIGEVTCERNTYKAELRSLAQALSRTIGRLCSPLCSAKLGDERCTKDLTAFTVTGTLDAVGVDNATLSDSARTEPGPATGISITGISNANPGVVTTATALTEPDGTAVMLSGITGTALLNGTTIIRNKSGATFELGIDTSDTAVYPAYTGGGKVTPLGGASGYFDYGVFTATSGACDGLSMEVKSYVPGQWTLQMPMPYPLAAGDTYSMVAGCDKLITTCLDKFDNVAPVGGGGFRGRPYVPGQDKLVQVGRHE